MRLTFQEERKIFDEISRIEEDYPNQREEMRRAKIVELAVQTADSVLMDFSNGEVAELDYLTVAVTMEFLKKVQGRLTSELLKAELGKRR